MKRNNNALKNHEKMTLNKDDIHVAGSQIPVNWQCISITIPLAKQVQTV